MKAEEVGHGNGAQRLLLDYGPTGGAAASGTAVSQITTAVKSHGGSVTGLDVTASGHEKLRIDVTIAASSTAHADEIVQQLRGIEGVTLGKVSDRTFLMHLGGKIEMQDRSTRSATVTTSP